MGCAQLLHARIALSRARVSYVAKSQARTGAMPPPKLNNPELYSDVVLASFSSCCVSPLSGFVGANEPVALVGVVVGRPSHVSKYPNFHDFCKEPR